MSDPTYPYDESLLQWIWQHLEFETQSLRTECGRQVRIINPGKKNNGAGPDFSECEILIDGVKCYGDTEIHIRPEGWARHNHQQSRLFNRVILHAVYSQGAGNAAKSILRPDGTKPPLLVLKPYLQKSLQVLLEQRNRSSLPCAGNLHFINQQAFEEQIEKAHFKYFEYKIDFLLSRYRPDLPVSGAWLHLLSAGIFNTLGIPVNRPQMERLHDRAYPFLCSAKNRRHFVELVCELAFSGSGEDFIDWSHSGMRPASRPGQRVHQAASFSYTLHNQPFKDFLSPDLSAWKQMVNSIPGAERPGRQMLGILKHTIYLPAAWLLGDLLHSEPLKSKAYTEWRNIRGGVPKEVAAPFKDSGFELNKQTRKPGLAHQLKRYCRPGNCHRCEVFKKAISS